ncbi:MAG: YbhB/YbcL family Raf kinase inhibitor-like protein [Methanotrichaceae archaeon]
MIALGCVIMVVLGCGCSVNCVEQNEASEMDEPELIEVKLGFDQFPDKYTCDGKDISPPIEIEGLNATSMALIVDDPDAPLGTFVHWVIWNIDPTEIVPDAIPKKGQISDPIKATQGTNDFGRIGYNGPCPPPGKPHRYFFKIYGLDDELDLSAGSTKVDLLEAMKGHILQQGEAMATYGR